MLENGEYQRVGETQSRVSNARVIAATNRDLRQEVRGGRFRADLYHRLSVFTIDVPPLRELGEDKRAAARSLPRVLCAPGAARPVRARRRRPMQLWLEYGFPGNVRELRNIVIRLTTKYAGETVNREQLQAELDLESLDVELPGLAVGQDFKSVLEAARRHLQMQKNFNLDETLAQWERGYVEAALMITQGNLTQAAKLLGIHRTTLYSRMQNYGDAERGGEGAAASRQAVHSATTAARTPRTRSRRTSRCTTAISD